MVPITLPSTNTAPDRCHSLPVRYPIASRPKQICEVNLVSWISTLRSTRAVNPRTTALRHGPVGADEQAGVSWTALIPAGASLAYLASTYRLGDGVTRERRELRTSLADRPGRESSPRPFGPEFAGQLPVPIGGADVGQAYNAHWQDPITAHGPDCLTLAPGEVASIYFHAFETDAAETRPIAPACPRSSSASPATGASPRAAPGPAAPQFGPNHARLGGPALLEQALCEFLKELNESGTALR